ncbi:MAG: rRNA pseudouridine synthase [Oscillospiraceae bacterium]|nr:rRNA pseudouridine synthase [Oscillospiraceae bacterium]
MAIQRLDRLLSDAHGVSRREAKALLRAGRVTVNGVPERDPERKIDTSCDTVAADGTALDLRPFHYYMLHKPAGILSATEDRTQKTMLELLPPEARRPGLAPVGRLDKDTTGLLLLTDDGALAHTLISPKRHVPKVYRALLDAPADAGMAAAFVAGLVLGDGTRCLPAVLEPICGGACITVYEGKYHQVKRMCAACGRTVMALHRERFGALTLDAALAPGQWRELDAAELDVLRQGCTGKTDCAPL